jgi:uncharacterized membrane protein
VSEPRRRAKITETSVAVTAYGSLQSDRNFDQYPNSQGVRKRRDKIMAQAIGTIILVVLALVAVAAILNFILAALGIFFTLIPLLIKLAVIGGVFYLAWMLFRKLAHSNEC